MKMKWGKPKKHKKENEEQGISVLPLKLKKWKDT